MQNSKTENLRYSTQAPQWTASPGMAPLRPGSNQPESPRLASPLPETLIEAPASEFSAWSSERGAKTPRYAAPDMFRSGYHFPVDVWSLGITIHQLLSGDSRPYRDYGSPDVLDELKSNYGDPREYLDWDGFSDEAKDLLEQMLDKEPENRPDLSEVLSHPWIAHHTAGIDRRSSSWVLPAEDEEGEDEDDD